MKNFSSTLKSQDGPVEFFAGLILNVLQDCRYKGYDIDDRDFECIYLRIQSEGLAFLTKTLPGFGRAVLTALNTGTPLTVLQFKKINRRLALPAFLQGLTAGVFNYYGEVLDEVDHQALRLLLQICFLCYKLELPFSTSMIARFEAKFERTDRSLPNDFDHLGTPDVRLEAAILDEARVLITAALDGFDPTDILPRHGPGAVATREKASQKFPLRRVYPQLEKFYPASEYFFASPKDLFWRFEDYRSMEDEVTSTSRVIFVPKDSRGPRVISAEPLEYQFIQQGLGRSLVTHLQMVGNIARRSVLFDDQTVNAGLALDSSLSRECATIDLKDASDRVSCALVRELFRDTEILPFLMASRSEYAELPGGRTIRLQKFAPMGSALCFPIEALCFWALSSATASVIHGDRLFQVAKRITVFGDDIVCPTPWFQSIVGHLHYFGLRINRDKCCVDSFFRESCGMDAYKGIKITPIKAKHLPSPDQSAEDLSQFVALANNLEYRSFLEASAYIRKYVRAKYGLIPIVHTVVRSEKLTSPAFALKFFIRDKYTDEPRPRVRYNLDLQRLEVRTPHILPVEEILPGYKRPWIIWPHLRSQATEYLRWHTMGSIKQGHYPIRYRTRLKWQYGPLRDHIAEPGKNRWRVT